MVIEKIPIEGPWILPVILGIISIPITLLFQWLSVGQYIVVPVLFAGLIAGYLVAEQPMSSRRLGWRTGLIGGLALLWGGFRFMTLIPEYSFGLSTSVLAAFSTILGIGLYIVYFGLLGGIGGLVGGWIANRTGRTGSLSIAN